MNRNAFFKHLTQKAQLQAGLCLFLCMLYLVGPVNAQADKAPIGEEPDALARLHAQQKAPHARVYQQAMEIGDHYTAITALHHLLVDDPENSFLQDSLAALYLYTGQKTVGLAWAEKCLKGRSDNLFLRSYCAQLYAEQGEYAPALQHFAHLHDLTGKSFFQYQMASMQLQLGRHGECLVNIEKMLQAPETEKAALHMTWGDGEGDIPMRAALLNLRGNLEEAVNQEGKARKSFRAALKLAPGFGLARNNLNALREKDRQRWEDDHDR